MRSLKDKNNNGCIFLWMAVSLAMSGCSLSAQSPDFLVLHSYFPSWLVGALFALIATVALRYVLVKTGVDDHLPLRFFVYVGIWLIGTMAMAYLYSPR